MKEEAVVSSILIVDDQPHLQQPFSQELMDEGYRVVSIGDAKSGMKYLADSKPDLVLLDLYLDGFQGWGRKAKRTMIVLSKENRSWRPER